MNLVEMKLTEEEYKILLHAARKYMGVLAVQENSRDAKKILAVIEKIESNLIKGLDSNAE